MNLTQLPEPLPEIILGAVMLVGVIVSPIIVLIWCTRDSTLWKHLTNLNH